VNDQASRDAAANPIVVPNALWTVADPVAHSGGLPSDITYLDPHADRSHDSAVTRLADHLLGRLGGSM
jgi:hypothetical protein